ncbi:MAG: hypothetical protein R2794_08805 [Chitinophagales bacterium]
MSTKKHFIALTLAWIVLAPVRIANSCGWFYDADDYMVSPFDQTIAGTPQLYPWFYSYHYYYGFSMDYMDGDPVQIFNSRSVNLHDWSEHFHDVYSTDDLERLIYSSTTSDFDELIKCLNGFKPSGSRFMQTEPVQDMLGGKWREEMQYLYSAKRIEPLVQEPDYWEPEPRDVETMSEYLDIILKTIPSVKDKFVRQRYIYQALRLAHYSGNYQGCLDLYDRFATDLQDGSLISYWCLSLKAGAHWRLKQYAESSYYNALVFANCPSRSLYAERDFWIDDDITWQNCIRMCKNDAEINTLWVLTGINQENSATTAMREILQRDPTSPYLDLLLGREIEKLQRNYMPERGSTDWSQVAQPGAYFYGEQLLSIINKGLNEKDLRTPSFWWSARAFVFYLNGDFTTARNNAQTALESAGDNTALSDQAKIIYAIASVHGIHEISDSTENEIAGILDMLPAADADADFYARSSTLLNAKKLIAFDLYSLFDKASLFPYKDAKAEICRSLFSDYYDLYQDPDIYTVGALIDYMDAPRSNPLDNWLKDQFQYPEDALYEIQGTLYMREYAWKEAIASFDRIQEPENVYTFSLPTDPFLIHTWDCHDCDFENDPSDYTKRTLAQEMLLLEDQLATHPANTAEICHKLGNAYYNMTHYGNSWMAADYYLCAGCDGDYGYDYMGPDNYHCDKAYQYYARAVKESKDAEFKAFNTFLMAKCEQNRYYQSDDYTWDNSSGAKEKYRDDFAELMHAYSKTEFYKKAIGECKYFDYYVSRH